MWINTKKHAGWRFGAAALTILLALQACTRGGKTPAVALEQYVAAVMSASGSGDREKLLEMTVGEAREQFTSMTEEQFLAAFPKGRYRLISLRIRDPREEKAGVVSLVYEVTFEDKGAGSPAVLTNKKVAYLEKAESDSWKIRGVRAVKNFVEQKDALEIRLGAEPVK
ncbi:MAG: hypothetical protein HUU37_00975 [Bdellovibrionales bacterium]|nr:hypothetical protein [Bdellovibrionales bacterium]